MGANQTVTLYGNTTRPLARHSIEMMSDAPMAVQLMNKHLQNKTEPS